MAYRISSIVEKWRFECLYADCTGDSHTNWFPINGHFRCRTCAEFRNADPGVEAEYDKLRDKRTGELVQREDIILETRKGVARTSD